MKRAFVIWLDVLSGDAGRCAGSGVCAMGDSEFGDCGAFGDGGGDHFDSAIWKAGMQSIPGDNEFGLRWRVIVGDLLHVSICIAHSTQQELTASAEAMTAV